MITLELTDDEVQALVSCLDVATRANGLEAARATLPLANKIMEQVSNQKPEEPEQCPSSTDSETT